MLIDGEKWACEACVRGHRVSNCQHADRPLQHINKKGRPVSQCQHCRAMRKSRSAHARCDCGEKTHKCIHLKTTVEGHKDSCCCNHGGRCTCSHKKESPQLDTVPESDSDRETSSSNTNSKASSKVAIPRRRANTVHSEGMLSFDEHGHHKPAHKHARASRKAGPYQLNRVNSMHSTSSGGNNSIDSLDRDSPVGSAGVAQEHSKSEAASPLMTGSSAFTQLNGQLPPLDLSACPPYVPTTDSFDLFGSVSSDYEQPMFSAGLSAASVDWSHYDGLEFASKAGDNFAPSNFSQAQSFGGIFEQPPTLTTSNSGEVSEVEDFVATAGDDFDVATFSRTASSGFLGSTQASLLGSTDFSGIDFDDFRFVKAGNKFLPSPSSLPTEDSSLAATAAADIASYSLVEDDPAFWMADYAHGLPVMTESPDPNATAFWGTQ
ncbi:Copper resistance protein CRF1 [Pleurostoma richardsiae]|uniref:Copper resistance protein CRF1 n=1 Tax=Pleurostoma richardsiae TaxID=41990 RepID=A0AA38R3M1_9PEZI|nr:Copper resistance protein CRF1 [Pleurostoma richardsiae]